MKNRKSINCGILFTMIALLILVTALAVPVYAEDETGLDTATLDGFKMTLKDYAQPYDAGIKLPGGATIIVKSDSGLQVVGKQGAAAQPVGIIVDGDLTIKGAAMLVIEGDNGVDGIQAAGNLQIGDGKDPAKGIQL